MHANIPLGGGMSNSRAIYMVNAMPCAVLGNVPTLAAAVIVP